MASQNGESDLAAIAFGEALNGSISIRLHPGLCPGGKTKRAGAFYEIYREAWNLLKEPEATEAAQNKNKME
jgi:hypothetical protein